MGSVAELIVAICASLVATVGAVLSAWKAIQKEVRRERQRLDDQEHRPAASAPPAADHPAAAPARPES